MEPDVSLSEGGWRDGGAVWITPMAGQMITSVHPVKSCWLFPAHQRSTRLSVLPLRFLCGSEDLTSVEAPS